ncbi:MAG: ABC transporter ATP-binding protein, partial [Rhodoglobus sp.]
PSVLLLDEPLGALDRQLREEMQLELKLLQSQLGITFVFVTHDQGEALSMSDRIAVMRDGRIEQLADANTIYAKPASAYVAAFIGQQNFLPGLLAKDAKHVETEIGALSAGRIDKALKAGDAAQAAIRPEFVHVMAASGNPPAGTQGAEGRLIGLSHLGESMQYLVQLKAGHSVLARRPTADAPALSIGDAVRCAWKPEHVQLFPADGAEEAAGFVRPPEAKQPTN